MNRENVINYVRLNKKSGMTRQENLESLKRVNQNNDVIFDQQELVKIVKNVYDEKEIIRLDKDFIDELKMRKNEYWENNKWNVPVFKACALASLITYKNADTQLLTGENRGYIVLNTKDKTLLRYDNGVYSFMADNYVSGVVHAVLGRNYSSARAKEVLNCIKDDANLKIEIDDLEVNPRYICFNNCIYDIETDTTFPHSPEFYFTNKIPYDYVKDAQCPNINKFFSEIVEGKNIHLLEEMFGWFLLRNYKYQYLVILNGSGANGKGTLLRLGHAFLGNNTTAMTLHEIIKDNFARARLFQKLANLGDDIGQESIEETDMIKRMTGDGKIFGQYKGKDGFDFFSYAKMVFPCNILPKYPKDDTFSLWRRIIVIEFPNRFHNETDNKNILETMVIDDEMSGLINLAIKGLKRLIANNKFTYERTVEETQQFYKDLSEPSKKFILDHYEFSSNSSDQLYKQVIWEEYSKWCEKHKIPMDSLRDFWSTFWQTIPGAMQGRVGYNQDPEQPRVVKCLKRKEGKNERLPM
jgi:P4 family phage/plasmid primase-like protien